MILRERLDPVWYWPAVLATCLLFLIMLIWNAFHYDVRGGFEAEAHFDYVRILREEQRLPTRQEVHNEWQIPPLFHATAAVLEAACSSISVSGDLCRKGGIVQLFNVLVATGTAILVLLTSRKIFPESPLAQFGALLMVVLAPPLTRAAVMYYGEALATLLTAAAMLFVTRALRDPSRWRSQSVLGGVAIGLAILTRQMALATFGALCLVFVLHALWTSNRRSIWAGVAFGATALLLSAPWFLHQHIRYGSPVAQGLKAPDIPFFERQPAEFFIGGPIKPVFSMPYRPSYANHMPQVLYTDWWGDYFEYFHARPYIGHVPLPEGYHEALVRQSFVGLLPSVLILGGLIGLAVRGVRGSEALMLAPVISVGAIAVAALYFFIGFPVPDGDTMKAIYLLTALPSLALAGGWSLERLAANRLIFAGVLLLLAAAAVVDVRFLWLESTVIP